MKLHAILGEGQGLELRPLLRMTSHARQAAERLRENEPAYRHKSLRVYLAGKGCDGFIYGVTFDDASFDDVTQETQGLRLIVDRASMPILMDSELDWVETPEAQGFVVRNPRHDLFRGKFFKQPHWQEMLFTRAIPTSSLHRVISSRKLLGGCLLLRLERGAFQFEAGQHVLVGIPDQTLKREYSLASRPDDPWLELLVRVMPNAGLSERLAGLKAGDLLELGAASGRFSLCELDEPRRHLFVVTGTGIAPALSLIRAHPNADYRLLHGIREAEEEYALEDVPHPRYIPCASRRPGEFFHGRVTDYLERFPSTDTDYFYLCGSSVMIREVLSLLKRLGVDRARIKTVQHS
jgi:ferredoxin--NADP+ reductase